MASVTNVKVITISALINAHGLINAHPPGLDIRNSDFLDDIWKIKILINFHCQKKNDPTVIDFRFNVA